MAREGPTDAVPKPGRGRNGRCKGPHQTVFQKLSFPETPRYNHTQGSGRRETVKRRVGPSRTLPRRRLLKFQVHGRRRAVSQGPGRASQPFRDQLLIRPGTAGGQRSRDGPRRGPEPDRSKLGPRPRGVGSHRPEVQDRSKSVARLAPGAYGGSGSKHTVPALMLTSTATSWGAGAPNPRHRTRGGELVKTIIHRAKGSPEARETGIESADDERAGSYRGHKEKRIRRKKSNPRVGEWVPRSWWGQGPKKAPGMGPPGGRARIGCLATPVTRTMRGSSPGGR